MQNNKKTFLILPDPRDADLELPFTPKFIIDSSAYVATLTEKELLNKHGMRRMLKESDAYNFEGALVVIVFD